MPVTDDSIAGLRVAVLGNTDPAVYWSTENEYVDAWERNGAVVSRYHEKHPEDWGRLIVDIRDYHFDLVQWTSTKDFRDAAGRQRQTQLAAACKNTDTPLAGVHLDVWIGLEREQNIIDDPWYFIGCDVLFTADGGHDDEWAGYGVNHKWLLPAISERWLGLGEYTGKWASDIAFVGSWQGGYHPESEHRHQLVQWLQDTYGDRVRFWPKKGQPRIVGRDLNDLYASTKVVVGDSCWLPGWKNYCSDRIPETAGRGGSLLHPWVEGVNADEHDPFYYACVAGWEMGDWSRLKTLIDGEIDNAYEPESDMWKSVRQVPLHAIADAHTYTARCREIVAELIGQGWL